MDSYADEVAATLATIDSIQFSPGALHLADSVLRLFLYPTMELIAQRGPEIKVVRNWPKGFKERVRLQFRHAARTLPLDQLPAYVAGFIRDRFAQACFAPLRRGMKALLLRYALLERAESGVRIYPVNENFLEQGFALHTTIARSAGERLVSVTAQIPHDMPPRKPAGNEDDDTSWHLASVQRWSGWAATDLPRFLLGPLRFAPFTCCPPRDCCQPNCKIVYSPQDRPLAATLVVTCDIRAGDRIIVEWSDVHLLLSSSPLACCVSLD
ncbi:hypothetical protein EXIGLDRAFT_780823 [Exidia glandulosa HHB12029]|uniref:SET domain-containing protein n=1 Tax=Exidia glandulosa HHB12029 TaxID=1314781 RepID=A0A165BFN0_EXIGL|nr:hypothetical protein EXIGLDRAFT_780823 [Exidia glandulosa HHB12029]